MALLGLAIVNAGFSYSAVTRHAEQWDSNPPSRTKIMAVLSIVFWWSSPAQSHIFDMMSNQRSR
jgi:hypothetical protein